MVKFIIFRFMSKFFCGGRNFLLNGIINGNGIVNGSVSLVLGSFKFWGYVVVF